MLVLSFWACSSDEDVNVIGKWKKESRISITTVGGVSPFGFRNSRAIQDTILVLGGHFTHKIVGIGLDDPNYTEDICISQIFAEHMNPDVKTSLDHRKYVFSFDIRDRFLGFTNTQSDCYSSGWSGIDFDKIVDRGEYDIYQMTYLLGDNIVSINEFILIPFYKRFVILRFYEETLNSGEGYVAGISKIAEIPFTNYQRIQSFDQSFFVSGDGLTLKIDTLGRYYEVSDQPLNIFKIGNEYHGLTIGDENSHEYLSYDRGDTWTFVKEHEGLKADSLNFSTILNVTVAYEGEKIYSYRNSGTESSFELLNVKGISGYDITSLSNYKDEYVFMTTFPKMPASEVYCYYMTIEDFFKQ